ncbi:YcxB family protein [Vibrio sp.]|nr:YcxB family protein [Vibrio sp.]
MPKDFSFTTEYTLDKPFYAECYDQTSRPVTFPRSYLMGGLFLLFGLVLLEFELLPTAHVGWFFIVLSIIEVFNIYFKRKWWLWRQTFGTGSGSKVALTINSDGLSYESDKHTRNIVWSDIVKVTQSDLGFIIHIGKQRQYLSKSCLNDEAIAYIIEQSETSQLCSLNKV